MQTDLKIYKLQNKPCIMQRFASMKICKNHKNKTNRESSICFCELNNELRRVKICVL
jgi:hypothetical protein